MVCGPFCQTNDSCSVSSRKTPSVTGPLGKEVVMSKSLWTFCSESVHVGKPLYPHTKNKVSQMKQKSETVVVPTYTVCIKTIPMPSDNIISSLSICCWLDKEFLVHTAVPWMLNSPVRSTFLSECVISWAEEIKIHLIWLPVMKSMKAGV